MKASYSVQLVLVISQKQLSKLVLISQVEEFVYQMAFYVQFGDFDIELQLHPDVKDNCCCFQSYQRNNN